MTGNSLPTSLPKTLDTNATLRALAHTALRIADGETIELGWLMEQLQSGTHDAGLPSVAASLLTIPEASIRLRVSKWSVYDLIHKKQLMSVKIGRRRFIPTGEVSKYLSSLPLSGGYLL